MFWIYFREDGRALVLCLSDHQGKLEDLKTGGDLSKVIFSNFVEMLVSCSPWTTRFVVDSESSGTISHKMERGMGPEASKIDPRHTHHTTGFSLYCRVGNMIVNCFS